MDFWLTCLMFTAGLASLWKGGDWLVDGAKSIALKLRIPSFLVGLTLVAVGTSMPELIVNIIAASSQKSDIVFGNVLGSNTANLLLILGLISMCYPLKESRTRIIPQIGWSLLFLMILGIALRLSKTTPFVLHYWGGIVLLLALAFYIYYLVSSSPKEEIAVEESTNPLLISIGSFALGLVLLLAGGKWVVDSVVTLAHHFQVSEALISVFAVAVGTSLPELVASFAAAKKGESSLALGNIIGSNIFNVGLILGVSSLITPLTFNPMFKFEVILFVMGNTLLIYFFKQSDTLTRLKSSVFFLLYIAFTIFVFLRG